MRYNLIHHESSGESIIQDDYISGLAKGLKLLDAFGIDRQKLNATQIAQRTGISRTAARRYLRTLKFLGYLDSDEHYFWLTHKVLRLSSSYLSSAHLPKIAQPILNILCGQTSLNYSVVVLEDDEVVPIARSFLPEQEMLRISLYGMHLGNRLPAHATSTGKILLSKFSQDEQQKWFKKFGLKRLTAFTLQDENEFYQMLKKVSLQDYCISKEEHELGVIAISVPILDAKGQAVAALNCMSQTHRVSEQYLLENILSLLRNTAYQIRAML
ncbi:IclR family transcriptional regulator C-terminal domain-containing protein [Acinetobacter sp. Marseille-Q1618]|uniref:IclR family transcriptional regulator domain-containing protein n=1 Tax=Acinetobacter sp. Marseille-Q1618 TaxID=2697502 RepID=UPI001570591C|nr:IclR family transcriptional regulator C-terminal domain-containing protein [Acinetobacter sp. Marseille-Q1618]